MNFMHIVEEPRHRLNLKLLPILIIFIVSCLVYVNTLANGFVFSDHNQIENNVWIRNVANIPKILSSSVWAFKDYYRGNYYRPTMMLSYLAGYHLFGLKAWGFHLISILLHALNAVLFFLIAIQLARRLRPTQASADIFEWTIARLKLQIESSILLPFFAALIFATHPIVSESVNWVGCYPELLFTMFCLLAFWLYLQWHSYGAERLRHWPLYLVSLFCYFIALLSKETALVFPVILFTYAVFSSSRVKPKTSRAKKQIRVWPELFAVLPYIIPVIFYLTLRIRILHGLDFPKRSPDLNFLGQVANTAWLFTQYLEKLLIPVKLNICHIFHPLQGLDDFRTILTFLVVLGFLAICWWARRCNRFVLMGLIWLVVSLMPVLYIPDFGQEYMAERYAYFSTMGFAMVLVGIIFHLRERLVIKAINLNRLVICSVIIIIASYSCTTLWRNRVWHSDATLWQDSIRKSPDGFIPNNSQGLVLLRQGKLDQALCHFNTAVQILPKFYSAIINIGDCYSLQGKDDLAIDYYQQALLLEPRRAEAYFQRALLYQKQLNYKLAIADYEQVLLRRKDYPQVNSNIALLYEHIGQMALAERHLKLELKFNHQDTRALYYLGNLYLQAGKFKEAIPLYEQADKRSKRNPKIYNNLGIAYGLQGDIARAISMFEEALRIDPVYQQAKINLQKAKARL